MIVFSGFTIRNCWNTGIDISPSSNSNTITDNIIHSVMGGSDTDGIEVTISSYNVISNNEIFDCDDEGIEKTGHRTIQLPTTRYIRLLERQLM
ncbi:Right handed beta helix region [Candidatus Methanophagaceae archaeon]|jgi:hypothetical protein|nr:Right handed beta helix region [Methanophagales archaeon]